MSGFEVAGVVLGVLPIVIGYLSTYREGKNPLATLVKFGGLLDDLIHQLKEQQRFFHLEILIFLQDAGVLDDSYIPEERCAAVLRDAKTSKEVMEYLGPLLYEGFLETLRLYESCLKEIASKLSNITRPENAAKDDLLAILRANSQHRQSSVRGRVKFTIDRKRLEALVKDFKSIRSSIGKHLKYARIQQDREATKSSHDSERVVRFFEQIHQSAASLHTAACHEWACDQHESHMIMIQLEHRLSKQSRAGQRAPAVFRLCCPDGETQFQEIEVRVDLNELDDFVKRGHPYNLQRGTKIGLPALSVTPADCNEPERTNVCATNMCDNVHEALQRGHILALRLNGHALDMMEEAIKAQKSYENVQTLADLLTSVSHRDHDPMMPFEQGLLALNITTAVLQLRHTSWCGSPWDKKSIKFLVETNGMIAPYAPYVEHEVGPELVATQNQQRSLKEMKMTILELAILMLEIFQQKSIDAWAFENLVQPPVTFSDRLNSARQWVEQSDGKLAPNHLTAVEACLAQCMKGRLEWNAEFQKLYCENVIQPLKVVTEVVKSSSKYGGLI